MALENYAYSIVLLFAIFVIIISVWNLFAFDKNDEDETIYFILNIISIVLSVGIIVWAIILMFGSGAEKSKFEVFKPVKNNNDDYIRYLLSQGLIANPPPTDAPPPPPIMNIETIPGMRFVPTISGQGTNVTQGVGLGFTN